MFLELSKH